jgi:hypothetical protein
MGAPESGLDAAEQPSAETLLSAFKSIAAAERRKHATVLNYWLSIRGDKEFPPLHDLDPLELSDAGPHSVLLELISGGHDAEVRHLGDALKGEGKVAQINQAPSPSILACIAKKLPIVAISRDFLAFEDEFETKAGTTRCWVTLLPLSAGGAWVDYVYALVSFDSGAEAEAEAAAVEPEAAAEAVEEPAETIEEPAADSSEEVLDTVEEPLAEDLEPDVAEAAEEPVAIDEPDAEQVEDEPRPGFSKLLDSIAGLTGFYGAGLKVTPTAAAAVAADEPEDEPSLADEQPAEEIKPVDEESPVEEPVAEPIEDSASEPPADESTVEEQPVEEPAAIVDEPTEPHVSEVEGTLQSKLADVRAKADEARQAKLRANAALYEGLSAAYDFALDAEGSPEEYLKLVEAQGLKIQLRNPMLPVVKLAFDGMCDASAITQLEAVLAWALEHDLPKGSLAERIEAAGGIAPILNGESKAAA